MHELSKLVVGQDPARINDLWQAMYRGGFYRGGPILMSAIAGIDQALWDIKGKALGVPVYELLGGRVRDRMKTYCWVGGDRPADIIESIHLVREAGFDTVKMNGTEEFGLLATHAEVDRVIAKFADIRTAFGSEINFGIDFHGRVALPMAKVLLRELEPLRPLFVEEPVLAEQSEHYARLAEGTSIPLAAGERMYSRFDFKRVLAAGGLAILQPDLSHAGGITECHKIAAMAEAHDVALAPHCPLGPVALAACLQVDWVAHNAVLQEQSAGIHYNRGAELLDYVTNRVRLPHRRRLHRAEQAAGAGRGDRRGARDRRQPRRAGLAQPAVAPRRRERRRMVNVASGTARLVALDWGSTRLRARLLGDGAAVLAERQNGDGASVLTGGASEFDEALTAIAGDWLAQGLPTLACGMVGSAHGWREAAVRALPGAAGRSARSSRRGSDAWRRRGAHRAGPGRRAGARHARRDARRGDASAGPLAGAS